MRRFPPGSFGLALAVFCGCAFAERFAPRIDGPCIVEKDVAYGRGYVSDSMGSTSFRLKDLVCDIYLPEGDPAGLARPALIFMHGGSFIGGAKEHWYFEQLARCLAGRSYVCLSLDYRMMGDYPPPAPSPYELSLMRPIHALFVDTKTAVRFLRANAAKYGVDSNRIAVGGDSAGAFGALAAGLADEADFASDGPGYPVPAENHPEMPGKPNAVLDFWGSALPVRDMFDAGDPPVLVVHGTHDKQFGTSFVFAREIVQTCTEKGIPVEFCALNGEGHDAWKVKYQGKDLAEVVWAFLERRMGRR